MIFCNETIKYWLMEYHDTNGFVCFSIYDKKETKLLARLKCFIEPQMISIQIVVYYV